MKIDYVPLLQIQRELQGMPRNYMTRRWGIAKSWAAESM
jgi:hypothetical protein